MVTKIVSKKKIQELLVGFKKIINMEQKLDHYAFTSTKNMS